MKQHEQIELLDELLALHESKSPYLDASWERPGLDRYLSADIFAREQQRIFHDLPQIAAHCSELREPGSFLTRNVAGQPLLLVRDETGTARAFYNVCRHRGAQLVGEETGCRQRFSCPYHAWTWNSAGELIGVPHEKTGFPGLDRGDFGLHAVACEEYAGWVWVSLADHGLIDVVSHLGEIAPEMRAMSADSHVIFASTTLDIAANWKILVEGGIESYHFRVAHRDTIAPLFLDNLSSYRCLGRHMRSILPRSTLPELREQPVEAWDLGKHANILYTLFPGPQFLVQEDHFIWIQGLPLAPDRTRLRLTTMIPAKENTHEKQAYWRRHHQFTSVTLDEDFVLGESIQRGLRSKANTHLNFGHFEGALARFNRFVDEAIG